MVFSPPLDRDDLCRGHFARRGRFVWWVDGEWLWTPVKSKDIGEVLTGSWDFSCSLLLFFDLIPVA